MQTLYGASKHPGVAIAVAVGVDAESGLEGVPHRIMSEGLRALRMGLPAAEQPEVVILCDILSLGSAVKIPGMRTIGIAAVTDDVPTLPVPVPCVCSVTGLPRITDDEVIAIVDGDSGLVHLDPDVETVIRYQNELAKEPAERVFLESVHIPARTQDGRTVFVAVLVSGIDEAEAGVSQGADMLFVHLDELVKAEVAANGERFVDAESDLFETLLALSAGKPTIVATEDSKERLEAIVRHYGAEHVQFVSPDDLPEVTPPELVEQIVLSGADRVVVSPREVADTKQTIRALPGEELDEASDDQDE